MTVSAGLRLEEEVTSCLTAEDAEGHRGELLRIRFASPSIPEGSQKLSSYQ